MELNHRPHAYQACALTGLSYRPAACFLKDHYLTDPSKLNSRLTLLTYFKYIFILQADITLFFNLSLERR